MQVQYLVVLKWLCWNDRYQGKYTNKRIVYQIGCHVTLTNGRQYRTCQLGNYQCHHLLVVVVTHHEEIYHQQQEHRNNNNKIKINNMTITIIMSVVVIVEYYKL